jgi:AraC-like DNA-binding protein
LLASVWGGEPELPAAMLGVGGEADLEHRLLVSSLRRGDDEHAAFEHSLAVATSVLAGACERRVMAGRPAKDRARSVLVGNTREALAADPALSLRQLAAAVGASPHHLSRIFVTATGTTIARHRMRLRARAALESLATGDHDLARLAADTGFADQSHLCRVIRSETGQTPSALRAALALRRGQPPLATGRAAASLVSSRKVRSTARDGGG